MTKNECISIFNNLIVDGGKIEQYILLISDYLKEIKYRKSKELITLIIQNPHLIQDTVPVIITYYCNKYCIFTLKAKNNQIILYYE